VAALFALHPLHVESVAWVAERKDVLSTFFFLLTLLAYAKYVAGGRRLVGRGGSNKEARRTNNQQPTTNIQHPISDAQHPASDIRHPASSIQYPVSNNTLHVSRFYVLALLFFALGLMSKPMLVTVPFVLLLLDYWPLRRMQNPSPRAFSLQPLAFSLLDKPGNAQLSTLNPQPSPRPFSLQPLAFSLLDKLPFFALSAAACVVTFLVQRRAGAVAGIGDWPLGYRVSNALISYVRYLLKAVWPAKLTVFYPPPAAWPLEWVVGAALALVAVSALAVWLARRAPWFAFGWFWYLGTLVPVIGIVQVGSQAMADRYSYIPLIGPFVAVAWGVAQLAERRPRTRAWLAAGGGAVVLACGWLTNQQVGYWRNSESLFNHALEVTSGNFVAHYALGAVCMTRGDAATAERHLAEAVRLKPYDADAQASLATALASVHQTRDAVEHYQEALKLQPNLPDALNNLAWILAANPDPEVRDGKKAVELAERACKLTDYKRPLLVGTLAAAYAEAGRFPEAVATAEKARTLAEQANQPDVAARNRALLELYRSGQPARDTP
jgi:Tfp pilus assembly protein PilF